MNAAQGTNRLIYEDAVWFLGKLLLLYITLPLTAAWILIGASFELENTYSSIASPAYFFFIPFYAVMGFKSLLPIAISLGSTRTQLLKSFYIVGTLSVIVCMLCLNVLQWMISILYQQGISSIAVMHVGLLHSDEFQFIPFLWMDLMFSFALFGLTFFIYCVTYRAGMTRTLIGIVLISIVCMFVYYSGGFDKVMEWLGTLNMSVMTAFTIAGALSLAAMFSTYPMMRNASLEPRQRRE